MTNECEHGRLARRCEICELIRVEDENSLRAQLKAANETIAELRDAFAATSSDEEMRLRAKVTDLEGELARVEGERDNMAIAIERWRIQEDLWWELEKNHKEVEGERDRLLEAIKNQCANLCTEAWTCGEWLNPRLEHPMATKHENIDECMSNLLERIEDLEKRVGRVEGGEDDDNT